MYGNCSSESTPSLETSCAPDTTLKKHNNNNNKKNKNQIPNFTFFFPQWLQLHYMEVPWPGTNSEPSVTYTTAGAMPEIEPMLPRNNTRLILNLLHHSRNPFVCLFVCLFVFGIAHRMQKFPSQELNLHHSSNLDLCSDNAGYLTHCTARKLWEVSIFIYLTEEAMLYKIFLMHKQLKYLG